MLGISIIRERLKSSKCVMDWHDSINAWWRAFLYGVSPVLLAKCRFRLLTGRALNLQDPKTFDEKLLWLMLFWQHPLKSECADKYVLRSYVARRGLGHILPDLLGVYETSREIDYASLPDRFVVKCTHGCGFNIVCKDKSTLNISETNRKLDEWMTKDISKLTGELHYAAMSPRIICERYLTGFEGGSPHDYKVYCFGGKTHCTMVCSERGPDGAQYDFYDRQWKSKLEYSRSSLLSKRKISKPAAYEAMIEIAEELSMPFPFVRMDFYSDNGKAVLGEMTFTPHGCIDPDYTDLAQHVMGELINLPKRLLG